MPSTTPSRAETSEPLKAARFIDRMLASVWNKGITPRPTLVAHDLIDHATRAEERAPAPGDWQDRLAVLCDALEDEARLSPLGRAIAHGQVVRKIRCRIRAEAHWERDPAILERRVERPLVIVGQMRSGTTRLHRLLARDPSFAHTRTYETMIPVPDGGRIDGRALTATANLLFLRTLNPLLAAVHPTGPFQAEEEFGLHAMSIFGAQFEGQWWVPSFARHCEDCDRTSVYREFRRTLQTIGHVRGERDDKPWVLKAPQFTQDLDELHAIFPDARYLFLSRDPAEVVASSASLAWQQARVQSQDITPAMIGEEWLRKTRLRATRMSDFRARHPDLDAHDVDFHAMNRDWLGEVAKIYDWLGQPLEPSVEQAMTAFVSGAKAHKGHHYDIADFGLCPDRVRAQLVPA
ncbi:sulfotransferase [Sphingomicrobium sp. XHP0235]|uniref:sulfotransferase family protein n=1 Tax=Sphingomicrobium aquimarinum TaxID=3133971 RepID=UPI0031FE4734